MKKQIHTLILPLLCLLGLSLYGQKSVDDVQIKVYAFEEGLSHRDVYQVLQEDSGFLWIGSRNGLNRFDSKNFTHIPVLPSAEERPVVAMHKAKDGQLWLSLSDQLVLFDLNTLTGRKAILQSTQIQHSQSDNIKHTLSFHTIHSDGDKGLWTCSYDSKSGMSQLQYSSSDHKLIPLISCKGNFEKRAVGKWNDRIIFAYDTNTLLEVDDSGEIYHRYSFEGERTWISQIQNQGDSLLWALSNEGQVYRLPKGSTTFKKIPISKHIEKQSSYESLWVADNGDIWVGGRNALWWYQAATDRLFDFTQNIKDYLKHNARFRHIYEDQTGVIWVSSDFGLIKLTFPNPLFAQYLYGDDGMCGASACSTRGITEDDDGNIYISFYSSIYKLHPYTDKLSPLFTDKELDNPPFGLLHHQGKLYTGNGKCIDLETEKVTSLLDMPLIDLGAVILDHEGDIWFGYRNRIYIYNPKTKKLRYRPDLTAAIDTQTLDISYLYQSPYDLTIWVASLTNGLFQLDKYKGLLAHYDTEGKNGMPLLHNKVNGIYEDRHQILWVATGKGLHRLDQERKHMNYYTPEHNGLTHSFLNGLLSEGDSVLWLSTDNGLTRFSIATEKGIGFKKEDGLTANEFNRMSFYKSKDGRMYFGGLEGVNAFYPGEQFLQNKKRKEGKVLLTEFSKLDGYKDSLMSWISGFKKDKTIRVSWKDRLLTFQFALANYDNPGIHQFSYKLEGLEHEWSAPTSLNVARYNILPHGDYTFRVRARNGNGTWNKTELAVPIHIEKAFYKTWWFLSLCLASLVGIVLLITQYRLHQSRKREETLQQQVRARTIELEKAMKKSDSLLLNILPKHIAEELKTFGKSKARRHPQVTVLFTDFKDFTGIAQKLPPEKLVDMIDHCFSAFDTIIGKYNLEKIKTIGDAYMCAGGIKQPHNDAATRVVSAALEMQNFMKDWAAGKKQNGEPFFEARIGIHSGEVVSGIVGTKKFAFDIWGQTVNIAARMEQSGAVGKVNISAATYDLVKTHFQCSPRGKISIKNMNEMEMYFVENLEA